MVGQFDRLRDQLAAIGVSLSVWGIEGREILPGEPACELCRTLCQYDVPCRAAREDLARRVIEQDTPLKDVSSCGSVAIGVPVRNRRKAVGAAVGCFPTASMVADEPLHRLCDQLQLDYETVAATVGDNGRHDVDHADDLLLVLGSMLQSEHALHVAGDELVSLSTNLATTYEELSLVYRISGTMKLTQQPEEFLRRDVCEELLEVMGIRAAAAIVYAHSSNDNTDQIIIAGDPGMEAEHVKLLAAAAVAPKFSDTVRSVVENDYAPSMPSGADADVERLVAVPMTSDENAIGMLLALNKVDNEFDSVDIKLISAIASQAAVFLTNSRLYADLQNLLLGVLDALTASIDAKDPYTCGHSKRVALISRRLAEECGFEPDHVERVYLAGLLHDIGKIGVPEGVLCKPGKLTDEEFMIIQRHPSISARILSGIRQLDDVVVGILTHHERPDGKGYPHGLRRSQMPIEGLMIGLADSFDAMTSDRVYRKALPLDDVIEEIKKHSGAQFDPGLVEKFLAMDLAEFLDDIRRSTDVMQEAAE
jgi:putative nucleotidyltransferase with HDIG domain